MNEANAVEPGAETVHGYFLRAIGEHSDRHFVEQVGEEPITYGQAARCVAATMSALDTLGIRRGHIVVSYLERSVDIALFDLACATMGIIPLPVSNQFSFDYLASMVSMVGAKAILSVRDLSERVSELERPVLFYDGSGAAASVHPQIVGLETRPDLSDARAAEIIAKLRVPVNGRDPFMIQPTSGSTGVPKLVVRPHAGFSRYAAFLGEQLDRPERPHVFLAVQALTHAFGLHIFTTALSLGATLAIPSEIDTNASLHDVWSLAPTVLTMVPRVLRSFHRQYVRELANAPARAFFPPSARTILVAGGRPDPEILGICSEQGIVPMEFYGSSEGSMVALTPRGGWRQGWAGRLLPDVQHVIAEDGELLIKSPGLMLGYHDAPALTSQAIQEDGYYRTGDTAEVSPDGYLRIRGRKADVFNTPEGSYVYPERIEMLIERFGWVRQAMLVGDQRPFLSCFIVVDDEGLTGEDPDGFLPEDRHPGLYARLAIDLMEINRGLERVERVVVFSLFVRPFHAGAYKSVGQGKVRRDRRIFELLYEARIARLYVLDLGAKSSPMHLHEERRYRPRKHLHVPVVRVRQRVRRRVVCHVKLSGEQPFRAVSRDVSMSGVFLEDVLDVAVGSAISVELAGVDAPIAGAVVRVLSDGVGVRFDAMNETTLGQLFNLVAGED